MNGLSALVAMVNGGARGTGWRYLLVVIGGFCIDMSLAWTAHEAFGVNLVAAAALGFLVAMCASYFAHEFWTFRREGSAVSGARAAKFVAASAATLATRLVLVWLSAPLAPLPAGSIVRLMFAFAGSLVVGYIVNRMIVFGAARR